MLIRRVDFFTASPNVYQLQTPRATRTLSLWAFYKLMDWTSVVFSACTQFYDTIWVKISSKKSCERLFGNHPHINKSQHIRKYFFLLFWIIAKDLSSVVEESPNKVKVVATWQIDVSISAMSVCKTSLTVIKLFKFLPLNVAKCKQGWTLSFTLLSLETINRKVYNVRSLSSNQCKRHHHVCSTHTAAENAIASRKRDKWLLIYLRKLW